MNRERVLVVAAHPDDEVLGCGATIARHASLGDEVHVIIVAEGATSRDGHDPQELADLRRAAHAAAAHLGVAHLTLLGLPDNRLDSLALLDVIKPIEAVTEAFAPTVAYTHHPGDLNVDHSIVHRATITALRPLPSSSLVSTLLFEVPSSTGWNSPGMSDFQPSWYVDAAPWIQDKHSALRAYESEMREWPHARSHDAVDALAQWRGSSVGLVAAEAFQLHRMTVRNP